MIFVMPFARAVTTVFVRVLVYINAELAFITELLTIVEGNVGSLSIKYEARADVGPILGTQLGLRVLIIDGKDDNDNGFEEKDELIEGLHVGMQVVPNIGFEFVVDAVGIQVISRLGLVVNNAEGGWLIDWYDGSIECCVDNWNEGIYD